MKFVLFRSEEKLITHKECNLAGLLGALQFYIMHYKLDICVILDKILILWWCEEHTCDKEGLDAMDSV